MKEHQRIPPTVPDDPQQLDQAIMLLGERTKGNLRQKNQDRLAQLLGKAPKDPEQAAVWKSVLKQVRKDEIFSE